VTNRNALAVGLLLGILLVAASGHAGSVGAAENGTQNASLSDRYDVTVGSGQTPGSPAELARIAKAKMAALRRYLGGRYNLYEFGILIPTSKTLSVSTIEQGLVHDYDSRRCVHCGATSALMALRYLEADGDLSSTDGMAIKQLGDGWLEGSEPSYAILRLDSNDEWWTPYRISSESARRDHRRLRNLGCNGVVEPGS